MQSKGSFNEKELREEWSSSLAKLKLINNAPELEDFKKRYLTTKESVIAFFIQEMVKLPPGEKGRFGKLLNQWKRELLVNIEQKFGDGLVSREKRQEEATRELPLEGKKIVVAKPHPIVKMVNDIYDFFTSHGYQIYEGPEVDNQWYNFSSLNIATDHPSRSTTDTFYLDNQGGTSHLLRTHTSNCQVRILEKNKNKEIKIVSIGKVYRRDDDDATHSHQYTNCELVVVGRKTSLADLKGTLEVFFKWIFRKDAQIRLRPSFFPFTEPSFEVDCTCVNCNKTSTNCSVCGGTGWVEVLGAGLIHPKVLKNGGYNTKLFSGFAAGIGVERIIMLKYGITDIRDLYLNNLRFLEQTEWR